MADGNTPRPLRFVETLSGDPLVRQAFERNLQRRAQGFTNPPDQPNALTQWLKQRGALPEDVPDTADILNKDTYDEVFAGLDDQRRLFLSANVGAFVGEHDQVRKLLVAAGEIPQPKRAKKWYEKAWGALVDIGGKPVGTVLDLLGVPVQWTEQAIGLLYWHDLPLDKRWEAGKYTLDAMGLFSDWPLIGRKDRKRVDTWRTEQAYRFAELVNSGKSIQEAAEESGIEDPLGNLIGQAAFDPLNFVGGPIWKAATGALRATGAGQVAAKIPIIRTLGKSRSAIETERAVHAALGDALEEARMSLNKRGRTGSLLRLGKLLQLTPEAKAEEAIGRVEYTMQALLNGAPGATNDDLLRLFTAAKEGRFDDIPEVFGLAIRQNQAGRDLQAALRAGDIDPAKLKSLRRAVASSPDDYDALDDVAKKTFYRTVEERNAAVMDNIIETFRPALFKAHGVGDEPEIIKALDRFAQAQKKVLAVTALNTPSFSVRNFLNNFTTLFVRNPRAGFHYLAATGRAVLKRDATEFYQLTARQKKMLGQMGIDADAVIRAAGSQSIAQAAGIQRNRWWKKWMTPFLGLTQHLDNAARFQAAITGMERVSNAVWKFSDKDGLGILPRIDRTRVPDWLASRIEAAVLNSRADPEEMARIRQALANGDYGSVITARKYVEEVLDEMEATGRLDPAVRQFWTETWPQSYLDVIDDIIHENLPAALEDVARLRVQQEIEAASRAPDAWIAEQLGVGDTAPSDFESWLARQVGEPAQTVAKELREAESPQAWIARQLGEDSAGETIETWIELQTRPVEPGIHRMMHQLDNLKGDLHGEAIYARTRDGVTPYARKGTIQQEIHHDIEEMARARHSKRLEMVARTMRALGYDNTREIAPVLDALDGAFLDLRTLRNQAWELTDQALAGRVSPDTVRDAWGNYYRTRYATMERARTETLRIVEGRNPKLARMFRRIFDEEEQVFRQVDEDLRNVQKEADRLASESRKANGFVDQDTSQRIGELYAQHRDRAEELFRTEIQRTNSMLGFRMTQDAIAVPGEYPIWADMVTLQNSYIGDFIDKIKPRILADIQTVQDPLSREALQYLDEYLTEVEQMVPDALQAINAGGRTYADWAMLNYHRRYGIDQWIQVVAPYHFWPTRTMARWAQLAWARPGAAAAFAKLRDFEEELDANLPARLRGKIRIPIPFLPDWTGNQIFVDPLPIMFPTEQWRRDELFDSTSSDDTVLGQLFRYSEQLPVSISPFVTGPLAFAGALGDRDQWISYQLNGLPGFIPGSRGQRAITAVLAGHGIADPTGIMSEEEVSRVLLGEALPEDRLREMLGLQPGDAWDAYRIDRMLANMAADDPDQFPADQVLRAMRERKGPVWEEAKRRALLESGWRGLTGYVLGLPVSIYPEGERVQRGLDAMYRQIGKEGASPQAYEEFFERYPEYRPRQIAVAGIGDEQERMQDLETSLFYIDLEQVSQPYDHRIEELDEEIAMAEQTLDLTTKEGRNQLQLLKDQRSALAAEKQDAIDKLEKEYPNRNRTFSYSRSPRDRALHELREQFYSIRPDGGYESQQAERERLLRGLQVESDPAAHFRLAVEAEVLRREYGERMQGKSEEEVQKLVEERDQKLDELKDRAASIVTRTEFENFLNRGKRPPSPQYAEYLTASKQMSEYMAINAAPLKDAEKRVLKRAYWNAHPLLEKYYGNDELVESVPSAELAVMLGRYEQIWDHYYSLDDDSRERLDYLYLVLEELNRIRQTFGLPPIQPIDYQRPELETYQGGVGIEQEVAALFK